MNYKKFTAKVDEETGKIAGFFSTYDKTPDSYGDIIEPGAFHLTRMATLSNRVHSPRQSQTAKLLVIRFLFVSITTSAP